MISINDYRNILSSDGNNLGQIKKNDSDKNINASFTLDPEYKRVYILTRDGWKWEDAKYFRHAKESISADAQDYYLQFRPKVHYPVGSYVIVPNDISPEINLTAEELQNPFLQPANQRTQWWFIVGRDQTNYVRYEILQCNWNFKWVANGEVQECLGALRNANSYTSGIWSSDYSTTLDELNAGWVPNTYLLYGDHLNDWGISDTRTLTHEIRLMNTNNVLDPKCYMITKVNEMTPQGVIKLSFKQDDYDEKRDNVDLLVCDYYSDTGHITVATEPDTEDTSKTSEISNYKVNTDNELVWDHKAITESIKIGRLTYFGVKFSDEDISPEWSLNIIDDTNELTKDEKAYYEGLIKINKFNDYNLSIKPGKANSLKGKRFTLSVKDSNGDYYSSCELEVES